MKEWPTAAELYKEIDLGIKDRAKVIVLDELVLVIPKKRRKREIRGILKGRLSLSSIELVREERKDWQ